MLSLFKKKKKEKLPARQRGNHCLNCDALLNGDENFCPECGQRNNTNPLSFKLVVDEFVGNLITYDSRVWNTAVPLLFKPGKVAYDFISGKRKNFVNPFRTYLTVSLMFFLVIGAIKQIQELNSDGSEESQAAIVKLNNTPLDSLAAKRKDSIAKATLEKVQKSIPKNIPINLDSTLQANNVNIDSLQKYNQDVGALADTLTDQSPFIKKVKAFYNYHEKNKEHTTAQALDSLGYENNFWNRFYYVRAQRTYEMTQDNAQGLNEKIFSGLSLAIFLFLPVFALFLKFIYLRRKYTFMEHMVFVFYTQSVLFLLLLLFNLIYYASGESDSVYIIAVLLFAIYLLIAMKNFYKQGWFKTFIKYTLANFSFLFISSLGLGILAFISFIFY
ncbi:MAG: DUF3667 domain-containing protein [Flavobacteriaceae bacterium]|nr:DUF3667 domain-containing protein [Flavobacteriaceae bacterium]